MPVVLIFSAALVTSLGIIFPPLWWCVLPGIAGFFHLLRTRVRKPVAAGFLGLSFGILTGFAGTIWFADTLPLDFLGIRSGGAAIVAVSMTWLYVACALGLPFALLALLLWRLRETHLFPLIATLGWPIAEWGRMWSFALFTWAPQSLSGPHFSVASVGYSLAENGALLALAHPFGIHALDLAAAAGAALIACIPQVLRDRKRSVAALAQCCLPPLTLLAAREPAPPSSRSPSIRVAVLAETIPDVRGIGTHAVVTRQLERLGSCARPVDAIILPEELSLTSIFWSKREADDFLKQHFGNCDILLFHTRNDLYPIDEKNLRPESKKLVFESSTRGEIGRYYKRMLMPLGEYAPALAKAFYSVVPDPELHSLVEETGDSLPPGPTVATAMVSHHGIRFGALLCSDMVSPYLYRTLAKDQRPDVLVNLANHFWFHGSRTLHWKTIQMAKVHAAQNRLPMIVANNMAPSFVLDRRGRVIAATEWGKPETIFLEVSPDSLRKSTE
jgi:apolipoprotein N-acyltransferase